MRVQAQTSKVYLGFEGASAIAPLTDMPELALYSTLQLQRLGAQHLGAAAVSP